MSFCSSLVHSTSCKCRTSRPIFIHLFYSTFTKAVVSLSILHFKIKDMVHNKRYGSMDLLLELLKALLRELRLVLLLLLLLYVLIT